MVRDFPLDPKLDDDRLKLMGQITVAFSALDYVLRAYVKSLLGAGFDVGMTVAAPYPVAWPDRSLCAFPPGPASGFPGGLPA